MENTITQNKESLTEVVFILDRSGSMSGYEDDTIGGFNSTIEKQKSEEENGKALISTVLFDNTCEVIHDRVDINEIEKLTRKEYYVRGCTALFDAIGGAINHIGNIHKYARKEDVPNNTIFVIITDGMENASREYTKGQVKDLIKRQQEKYGWEFIFLGANIDSAETAESIGIRRERAVDYTQDAKGFDASYKSVHCAIAGVRKCGSMDNHWRAHIDNDNRRRKKK